MVERMRVSPLAANSWTGEWRSSANCILMIAGRRCGRRGCSPHQVDTELSEQSGGPLAAQHGQCQELLQLLVRE